MTSSLILIKRINSNVTEQREIEKFGVGNLFPDSHPPEFSFFNKKRIDVALGISMELCIVTAKWCSKKID